jgi:hypothetical protein
MRICTQTKKQILSAGISRGKYAPKASNIKKLKVYLNKIENGS